MSNKVEEATPELLTELSKQAEDPRRKPAVVEKQEKVKSAHTVEELEEKVADDKIWVKCVSKLHPCAENNIRMEYWKDYKISIEMAIKFEESRFAVILETPSEKD